MFARVLVLLPALLSLLLVAPPSMATERGGGFADTAGTGHADAVDALADRGIVRGCEDGRFCARDELTRGQVATIVARALDLPLEGNGSSGRFHDTAGSTHGGAIDAVAAAGLITGCEGERFCPQDPITREQLATVLARAFDVPEAPSGERVFVDVDGVHAPAVAGITQAGISNGCDLVAFCPDDPLQRVHAAAFFARALDLVDRVEVAPFADREAAHEQRLVQERAAEAEAAAQAASRGAEAEAAEAEAAAAETAPAAQAVEVAMAQLGKPYRWGGSGPTHFDCSGLTSYAWAAAGVDLPRTSRAQYAATTRISRSELRPGDLVFYHSPVSHVAVYIGDGRVVESPNSGSNVRIREDGLTRNGVVGYGRP